MDCTYLNDAKYVDEFRIYLSFNDGVSGEVDLKDVIYKYDAASTLRDPKKFANFYYKAGK